MKNWRRNYFYENTGLRWVPPSPNLRTLKGTIVYPGLEILQNGGVSVGRGTETPFEEFGAPWMHGEEVAARLNERAYCRTAIAGWNSFRWRGCMRGRNAVEWGFGGDKRRGAVDEHRHGDCDSDEGALSGAI